MVELMLCDHSVLTFNEMTQLVQSSEIIILDDGDGLSSSVICQCGSA